MKFSTLVLDFDGTLGDSRRLITSTMRETFAAMNLPERSEAECASTIGLPLAKGFYQLLGDENLARECAALYTNELFPKNNKPGSVPPFPHVVSTLRELHQEGLALTVASSRRSPSLMQLLTEMKVKELFSLIVSVLDVENAKPAPDMVLKILKDTSSEPARTLVVGDTSFDIEMGRTAGCHTCGVTYGNGTVPELQAAGADYLIDDFRDLLKLCR